MTPTEIVLAFATAVFVDFDAEAARGLVAPDYIQHNPSVPSGAEPILGVIPALKESGLTVETHRVIAEGDLVVVHGTYSNAQLFGGDTLVGFDVFRVEDGKVAEHWDNLQPIVTETVSGRSMTDGPTEITDLDKTAENKALVMGFVETVLQGGDASTITDFISTETYHQHNPGVGDGLDGLGAALAAMAEQGLAMVYTRTPLVVAQGNFVFTGSEGTFGGASTAFYDLFRVENGKIVEHWDVIQAIPDEMAHDNGKF
ncbi:nuclear transport factor 2 family protein [Pacificoceanicola onchidii]|uniref:nuclear transport factor 2 family protein n=1 Tax=Pacificoceanicola onchidii TaxID=2562685 RepID=UPI0010A641D9|nr:nuclear transport factor 2 family protein [Pacificoceanicola onchidii]